MKRIILTGGGTGGHIMPLIAVARELKQLDPECYVIYVGERNGKFRHMTENNPDFDESHHIFAGKFRRYHKESWLKRIFSFRTNLLNLRDVFYFVIGFLQSVGLVRRLRPDMILLKGGFVGVPVGLAAAILKKPFITHDSDAVPGLANRLVSKWALYHATGMPAEYYKYPQEAIRYVGVLVSNDYQMITEEIQASLKDQLGIPQSNKVLLITGGSHGAAAINKAVSRIAPDLLAQDPELYIIHQVGLKNTGVYEGFTHDRLQVHELLKPMHVYTGSADVVITRAGANTMAELGIQGKACIVIPNPLLTGGHQLKNADLWRDKKAAVVLDESEIQTDSSRLFESVTALLANQSKREALGRSLEALTVKHATKKIAALLLDTKTDESA